MRQVISRLLLLALACGLAGCEKGEPARGGPAKVRVQLNWFPESEFGGLYEAHQRGLFEAAGLRVELLKGGPSVPAPQMVASGQVAFAVVSGPQLLALRSQGGGVTAVFATFQKNPRCIVVREDSKYDSLEALWKSSATVMGENGLEFIKWLNLEYGGEKLLFVPYSGGLASFIAGKVDAMQCFATAEPVQLQIDGLRTRVFLVSDTGYNPYETVIAVNDAFWEANPKIVADFASALRAGWDSYLASPEETNRYMHGLNPDMTMKVLEISSSLLSGFVRSDATGKHGLGWMEARRWNELKTQLVKIDHLSEAAAENAGTVFANPKAAGPPGLHGK